MSLWKTMKNEVLLKAKEDKMLPENQRKKFRQERSKFEGRDKLQDQVTSSPGVSDRGIEVRRGDARNKGVVSHGYARVFEDPKKHMESAKKMFRKDLNLEHYSSHQNLTHIDPAHQGSGTDAGKAYQQRKTDHPISFFYRAGTEPEHIVTSKAKSKYSIQLGPQHKIYDIGQDPENIIGKLREQTMNRQVNPGVVDQNDIHSAIKSAGYHGYFNSASALPNVVAMYHKMPVKREEKL